MIEKVGLMPTRDDVWETVKQEDDPGNLKATVFNMAEDAEFGWSAHPNYSAIQLGKPADFVTQALEGKISPEEAAQKGHNFIQGILDEDQF